MATSDNNSETKVRKRIKQAQTLTEMQIEHAFSLAKKHKIPEGKQVDFVVAVAAIEATNYVSFLSGDLG